MTSAMTPRRAYHGQEYPPHFVVSHEWRRGRQVLRPGGLFTWRGHPGTYRFQAHVTNPEAPGGPAQWVEATGPHGLARGAGPRQRYIRPDEIGTVKRSPR